MISNSGLSEDDMERYRILLQTRGNRPDIFGNDIYATPGGEYTDYDIPGEALTDTRFANMIREAENIWDTRMCGAAAARLPPLTAPDLFPM